MQKITPILVFLVLFIQCSSPKKRNPTQIRTLKETTNTIIDNWHLAATEAHYKNYFNAMDTVAVFIGTDASENWTKSEFQKFCKPYFDKGKAWDFKVLERNTYVSSYGNTVWFDELLQTWMGTCRGSGVLEKTNNHWKIKHYVLSLTIPNDDINTVIKATKKNDSIFLAKKLSP